MVHSEGGVGARLTAGKIPDAPGSELRLLVAVTQAPSAPMAASENLMDGVEVTT